MLSKLFLEDVQSMISTSGVAMHQKTHRDDIIINLTEMTGPARKPSETFIRYFTYQASLEDSGCGEFSSVLLAS